MNDVSGKCFLQNYTHNLKTVGLNSALEINDYNKFDALMGGFFFVPSDKRVKGSVQCTRRLLTSTAAKVLLFATLRWFNFYSHDLSCCRYGRKNNSQTRR